MRLTEPLGSQAVPVPHHRLVPPLVATWSVALQSSGGNLRSSLCSCAQRHRRCALLL